MKIYVEKSLAEFKFWSGAINTADKIDEFNKWDELEEILEEFYPDGIDEIELNDLFWFDSETVFEWLGINDDENEDDFDEEEDEDDEDEEDEDE